MRGKRVITITIESLQVLLAVLPGVLFLQGCSDSTVERKKFVDFYADYITAQDSSGFGEKVSASIREELCKKYNITAKAYENTVNDLKESRTEWEAFFNEVIAELEKRRDAEAKKSL